MFNFLFKLVVLIVVLFIISQLEYKGRKVQTYAEELIKSIKGKKGVIYIEEEKTSRSSEGVFKKKPRARRKVIKIVKEPEGDYQEETEEDRMELMNVFK